jgi:E3 ubiquitin-protein ligase SHPRH
MAAALCHPESGEGTVHVVGGWGTKMDAIVRRILWLRRTSTSGAPAQKVIVFSEWLEVLLILQHALSANHVACARAGGGRAAACAAALAAFRRDDALPVLLLPIARGANGLTLVEACHVILVEPLLDAGVEAQATKRVDRIGQAHPTCVHRFLVNATVEVNVRALCARRGHAGAEEEVVGTQAPRLRACDVMSLLT